MHLLCIFRELLIVRSDVTGVLLITHPATHVPFIRLAGIIIRESLLIALQRLMHSSDTYFTFSHLFMHFLFSPLNSVVLWFLVAFTSQAHSYRWCDNALMHWFGMILGVTAYRTRTFNNGQHQIPFSKGKKPSAEFQTLIFLQPHFCHWE